MADVKPDSGGQGDSPSQSGHAILDKKAFGAWRTNFDLHVLMLMKKHPVLSKAQAQVQAYHEGVDGLNKRLG